MLPFQLRLPTAVNEVTLNMADPIAFLIGFTFFVFWLLDKQRTALWAQTWLWCGVDVSGGDADIWLAGWVY